MKKISYFLMFNLFIFTFPVKAKDPQSAIENHEKAVKSEAQCESTPGKIFYNDQCLSTAEFELAKKRSCDNEKDKTFYNGQCISKDEAQKYIKENLEMSPDLRLLEGELQNCLNTKFKLSKTEPRLLKSKILIKKIRKDCADENKTVDDQRRATGATILTPATSKDVPTSEK